MALKRIKEHMIDQEFVQKVNNHTNELNNVKTDLAQIKTEKISKGNVSVSDIDKNLGKLDQTYMSDEFLQQMAGNTPINSTPADNTLTTQKYVDKSVTRAKIADVFQFVGNVEDGTDLNTLTREGTYSLTNSHTYVNCPPELQGKTANLTVKAVTSNNRFVLQTGFTQLEPNAFIIRRVDTVSTGTTEWVSLKNFSMSDIPQKSLGGELIKDKTLVRNHLDKRVLNNGVVSAGDFNTLTDDGNYFIAGTLSNLPLNAPSYGILTVKNVGNFTHQIYTDLYNPENSWIRYVQTNVSNYGTWVDLNKTSNTGLPLEGEQVVNFGDSIFGNKRGTDSVSHFIAQRTGATTYNIGFGGSRIAKHDPYWDAFSLYRLSDEIIKDDTDPTKWQLQEDALAQGLSSMPTYFRETLDLLKTLDFNVINFITIAGGTNDFTASVLLDNEVDKYDTTTLGGSFRYSLEKIWGKFPHLKVLICSPIYRAWVDENDQFIEDSEVRTYNGKYLYDFVEKEREIAKEYKTPFLDNYYELGINRYNRTLYYPSWDGTHPNVTGNEKIGNKVGSALISSF